MNERMIGMEKKIQSRILINMLIDQIKTQHCKLLKKLKVKRIYIKKDIDSRALMSQHRLWKKVSKGEWSLQSEIWVNENKLAQIAEGIKNMDNAEMYVDYFYKTLLHELRHSAQQQYIYNKFKNKTLYRRFMFWQHQLYGESYNWESSLEKDAFSYMENGTYDDNIFQGFEKFDDEINTFLHRESYFIKEIL